MDAPQAVIFDVDGTLLSTGGAGGRSWGRASLRLYGQEADITEFTDTGMTDPQVGTEVFRHVHDRDPSPEELAELISSYLWFLPDEISASDGYKVLPGARETLERLNAHDVPVGIVTGAMEAGSHAKLGRGRLNGLLQFGGFGSDSPDRTEITLKAIERGARLLGRELRPEQCYIVGDTPKDVEAAHAAGAIAVGVASHKYTREQLAESGPEHLLDALTEPLPGLP
jgi:phosphoglycolate phosphatase-like HAD superfamily hydrolase